MLGNDPSATAPLALQVAKHDAAINAWAASGCASASLEAALGPRTLRLFQKVRPALVLPAAAHCGADAWCRARSLAEVTAMAEAASVRCAMLLVVVCYQMDFWEKLLFR